MAGRRFVKDRERLAVIPFAAVNRDDGSFAFAEGLEGSRYPARS